MTGSVLDALRRRAYDEAGPLPPVELRPADAVGHVLREDVTARADLPAHELAATDGWAVAGPGPWHVTSAAAGDGTVVDGSAVVVGSGDVLPPGATSVVGRDEGQVEGGRLHARTSLGEHVRPRASECARGALLVPDGTVLTAGAAALAAAGGCADLLVTGRPTVALLVPSGPAVDAAVTAAIEVMVLGIVGDAGAADTAARQVPGTAAGLRGALDATHADLVVVVGPAADERARHLDALLADARADVVVDGASDASWVDGAHGWLLARLRDGRLLVAVPGDVRGAVAATLTLARPLVRGLCGYPYEPEAERVIDAELIGTGRHSSFAFVRADRPTPDRGPSTGHGVAAADALVLVPPHGAPAGSALPVLPLPAS